MMFEELSKDYREQIDQTAVILNVLLREKYAICIGFGDALYKADNNRQLYLNLGGGDTEALIRESHEIVYKIGKFDIESQLELVSKLDAEYSRISSQTVHPDVMKAEMIDHLCSVFKSFQTFIETEDLRDDLETLQKNIDFLFKSKSESTEHICNITKFGYKLCECKEQYVENMHFLRRLMEYFSVPTECPPHL